MTRTNSFDGTIVTVPFGSDAVDTAVKDEFRRLNERHEIDEILVLTGSPTSMATVRDHLGDCVPGSDVPDVTSVIVHATDVVNRSSDVVVLSDRMRRELAHRFLERYEWDSAYLQRASEQPSFVGDVARIMETAVWQDATLDTTPELREIGDAIDAFHDWLGEHGHVERGQLVSKATYALKRTGDELIDASAILAVEFEEFRPLDRTYLGAIAEGSDLVCVAETDASVRRSRIESGRIDDHVSFSHRRSVDGSPSTRPAATAAYLATGSTSEDPGVGDVHVHGADSADDQFQFVTDEIERLVEREGWQYDDVALATNGGGSAITDGVRTLQRAGIPTASTTVTGFGDDPAVRELLHVVRYLSADSDARSELLDEHPVLDEALLESVEETTGYAAALRRWATDSNLKVRIADETNPLDARASFGNVKRAFAMAEFLEGTEFLDASWETLAEMLERSHEHASHESQTSATDLDGGVRVDHLEAIKGGSFRAVFIVDVVDDVFPGTPSYTTLFPESRVSTMSDYPRVTAVDEEDVETTFRTDSTASSRPHRRYYTEYARRLLAVGSAAASERLYFCLYTFEGTALDERAQPSRFLAYCYRDLPWVSDGSDPLIESERAAEQYLLSRVDRALADVQRVNFRDIGVAVDDIKADFDEIERLLDESGDRGERLRDALRARVSFADGVIRRE